MNPTPEELIDRSAEPPLAIDLTCNRCGRAQSGSFDWACVDPNHDPKRLDWDGVSLSRSLICADCGVVDDYTLDPKSWLELLGRALGVVKEEDGSAGRRARRPGRVLVGRSLLWDGTIVHRPSQALARLRELAAERPLCAEAHRRLGNGCERFGFMEDAVAEWERAVELDPHEIEAQYSLALHWLGPGLRARDGFAALCSALAALPKALAARPELHPWCHAIVRLLRDVVAQTTEPLALKAVWRTGTSKASALRPPPVGRRSHPPPMNGQVVVTMSEVDLRKVPDFERLAEFVARPTLLGLTVSNALPEGEPTILQRILAGSSEEECSSDGWEKAERPKRSTSPPPRRRAPTAVGRNEPCPCHSGKKFKRCCGR